MPGVGVVLKHFAAQGAGIGGRNGSGGPIGPRELREIHLPAARAGIAEGAIGIMAAYNDIDGIPCQANTDLLTGLLRDEWGFDGIVMADLGAIDRLIDTTGNATVAGALALRSGVDISLCDRSYESLEDAVASGFVDLATIDRAVARVLSVKVRLGLLDAPQPPVAFPAPNPQPSLVASTPVLLENRLLPLPAVPARIAVIGPNADDAACLLGDYVPPIDRADVHTVLDGIRRHAPDAAISHVAGSTLTAEIEGGIEHAVEAARSADLVILVLGGSSERRYDDDFDDNGAAASASIATSKEGFDLRGLALPAAQIKLARAVAATGTPVATVIVAGRPHAIDDIAAISDALLYAWYPGPSGGDAIGAVLLGGREPLGRLPVSLPSDSSQLPVSYNLRHEYSRRYVDGPADAAYRFGYGLSFTTWALGEATASGTWPLVSVSAEITNTGERDGTQVVQLYGRTRTPGVQTRSAVLLGWSVVAVPAGQSTGVRVDVAGDAIAPLGSPAEGDAELWLSIVGARPSGAPLGVPIGHRTGGEQHL